MNALIIYGKRLGIYYMNRFTLGFLVFIHCITHSLDHDFFIKNDFGVTYPQVFLKGFQARYIKMVDIITGKALAINQRATGHDFILAVIPNNYVLAGMVLANLFKAHIAVYQKIKNLPYSDNVFVGIIHQASHFKPLIKSGINSIHNPVSRRLAQFFNKYFAHKTFMHFFKTGIFKYPTPRGKTITFTDHNAPKTLDFIGLNFYADVLFGPTPTCYPKEQMTDMTSWAIRPQSMYCAIQDMASLHVPIITENGICDAQDDRRDAWIIGYSNAVKQAIDDGYDIRGYCYWFLLDNYEWNIGHNKKFGLYAVDTLSNNPADKERILRKGAESYRDYVHVKGL